MPVVRRTQAAAKAAAIITRDSRHPSTRDVFIPSVVMPRSRSGIFIFQMATDVGARMMSRYTHAKAGVKTLTWKMFFARTSLTSMPMVINPRA